MTRAEIIATLKANAAALKARGVEHISLFGSSARSDAGSSSDIDLAIDIDSRTSLSGYDIVAIERMLGDLLGAPVDVVVKPVRRASLRDEIDKDGVLAF